MLNETKRVHDDNNEILSTSTDGHDLNRTSNADRPSHRHEIEAQTIRASFSRADRGLHGRFVSSRVAETMANGLRTSIPRTIRRGETAEASMRLCASTRPAASRHPDNVMPRNAAIDRLSSFPSTTVREEIKISTPRQRRRRRRNNVIVCRRLVECIARAVGC